MSMNRSNFLFQPNFGSEPAEQEKKDSIEAADRAGALDWGVGGDRHRSLRVLADGQAVSRRGGVGVVLVIVFYPVHRRLATRITRRGLRALVSCTLSYS